MTDWWSELEGALESGSDEAPDPWAHLDGHLAVELTDEQLAFLRQLADQPEMSIGDDE
jgi:hypothetical protein